MNATKITAETILEQYKNGRRDFRDLDLSGLDFSWADLADADFRGANLQKTIFKNADLTHVDFSEGTNLSFADFSGAKLKDIDFRGSNLQGSCFRESTIINALFDEMTNFPMGFQSFFFSMSAKQTDSLSEESHQLKCQLEEERAQSLSIVVKLQQEADDLRRQLETLQSKLKANENHAANLSKQHRQSLKDIEKLQHKHKTETKDLVRRIAAANMKISDYELRLIRADLIIQRSNFWNL